MNWDLKPLSDLCTLAIDCVNKTAPLSDEETPYKMLRTTNIRSGFIDFDNVRYVTKSTFEKWTRRGKPQFGDVVFTREAPAGEVGRFTEKTGNYFLGQRTFMYRADPLKLDWNFLAYILQTPQIQGWVQGIAYGATVPHLKVGDMEHLTVPCPPLPTQKKIAGILSAYDDLIEANTKRIKLLEELAQITYEEWFVRLRFPGHETTPINPTTGLLEGWEKIKLDNACNVSGGGTPSKLQQEYWENGEITWFSPTDLSKAGSLCLLESSTKITKLGLNKSSAKLLNSDSFMMTSRATIGLFGLINKPFSTNQGFINVTPLHKHEKYYLLFNFKSRIDEFYGHASGATFPEISKSKFKMLTIHWPDESLLIKFNTRVSPIINLMMNLTEENQHLREARDILLPRLMTGLIDAQTYTPPLNTTPKTAHPTAPKTMEPVA